MKYERIRTLRKEAHLTQTQIARYLNMSQTGYSKYETGENEIPVSILSMIADYYHVSIDYLMNRTDEKQPYPRKQKP